MRVEVTYTETSHRQFAVDVDREPTGQRLVDLIEEFGDESIETDGGWDPASITTRVIG